MAILNTIQKPRFLKYFSVRFKHGFYLQEVLDNFQVWWELVVVMVVVVVVVYFLVKT